jgi:excisionase family DNA binding protein
MTVQQAAWALTVHPRTVLRAIDAGELSAVKVRGRWRVPPDALDAWVRADGNDATTPRRTAGRERLRRAGGRPLAEAFANTPKGDNL